MNPWIITGYNIGDEAGVICNLVVWVLYGEKAMNLLFVVQHSHKCVPCSNDLTKCIELSYYLTNILNFLPTIWRDSLTTPVFSGYYRWLYFSVLCLSVVTWNAHCNIFISPFILEMFIPQKFCFWSWNYIPVLPVVYDSNQQQFFFNFKNVFCDWSKSVHLKIRMCWCVHGF